MTRPFLLSACVSLAAALALGSTPAWATPGFDATNPDATFTGVEVEDLEGTVRLWSAIERFEDPDRTIFDDGLYNSSTEWPNTASYAPYISTCFATQQPHTSAFLLHVGPSAAIASGTPILFVPGAADNASRGFITMAWHEDLLGRPVYAMTFAHPHGDVYSQAEEIADAIARVKVRTGAAQVDLVGHSKGGIAAAVYTSNFSGASWNDPAYESKGTDYRGDVRRLVLIATPLAGIDTAFRWPMGNFTSLDADTAFSPSSWQRYYPYTTAYSWDYEDLSGQDFYAEEGDLFPGQRQIYARQSAYELPGALPWLGAYALQPDWYTTYEGGLGYYSWSDGIDAVVEAAGGTLDLLAENGVDPAVEIYLLAGNNPLMPNGYDDWVAANYSDSWEEMGMPTQSQWADIVASAVGDGLMAEGISEEELQGLVSGDLILGEISGESDGLVFVTSATAGERLTARGATVVDTHVANLSHLDLLYASPITGELLIDAGAADDDDAWMIAFGQRYAEEDSIGIVEAWLADEEAEDTGDTGSDDSGADDTATDGDDSGTTEGDDTGEAHDGTGTVDDEPSELPEECGACNGGRAVPYALPVLLAFAAGARRRR